MAVPEIPCPANLNITSAFGNIFERKWCFESVKEFLNNSNITTTPACMRHLFVDGTNTSPDSPLLTLQGCKQFCGVDWGYYPDSASRVVDWVVPIIVLLSNINLSPVERKTMTGIIHALGDPIDTLWSILDKLYAWYICSQAARRAVEEADVPARRESSAQGVRTIVIGRVVDNVTDGGPENGKDKRDEPMVTIRVVPSNQSDTSNQPDRDPDASAINNNTDNDVTSDITHKERIRIIATVLAGFEELAGHLLPHPAQFYQKAITQLGNVASPSSSTTTGTTHWQSTALSLVDDRTNEFLRTGIAVTLYLFQVFSEFIDQISQNSENTPGGRIGAAMMLSWLIPVVLLSNLLGGFPSRRSNLKPLLDLVNHALPPYDTQHPAISLAPLPPGNEQLAMLTSRPPIPTNPPTDKSLTTWPSYFASQPLTGAIYGFRPHKTLTLSHSTGTDRLIRWLLPLFAALPVIASFLASFILHWEAVPSGFSCRHVWVIVVFGLWVLSVVVTNLLAGPLRRGVWWCWWVIIVKDGVIGLGAVGMIIASVIGVFNSCFCWSLAIWLGEGAAVMMVNTKGRYLEYKRELYPALVGGFVLVQLVFVVGVGVGMWKGLGVMRWGEGVKRKGWEGLREEGELVALRRFVCFCRGG